MTADPKQSKTTTLIQTTSNTSSPSLSTSSPYKRSGDWRTRLRSRSRSFMRACTACGYRNSRAGKRADAFRLWSRSFCPICCILGDNASWKHIDVVFARTMIENRFHLLITLGFRGLLITLGFLTLVFLGHLLQLLKLLAHEGVRTSEARGLVRCCNSSLWLWTRPVMRVEPFDFFDCSSL